MGEMHEESDAQLLRDYAEDGNEAAFRELVTRHTDLVYSAALRQVYSPDLAGDIAQSVFTDLARKACPLAETMPAGGSLAGWLHRGTRYAALSHLRDTRCRLANERQAMEQLLTNSESAPDWERIRPVLDEALDSLGDEDREALLLRYFKNHDFRAVGVALGVSDDAAQKRVSRAVESLREFFVKRGVAVGTSGLVALICANAVQAAPVGLAVMISTAAALGGTTLAVTKIIAMTTLQKTLITAVLVVVSGAGIYQARQVSRLGDQVRSLKQDQTPMTKQIEQLQRERDDATSQLAALRNRIETSNPDNNELLRLRGTVGLLRGQLVSATNGAPSASAQSQSQPTYAAWRLREPLQLDEFHNVGNATPEAAAETLLWAAHNPSTNLLDMVNLPAGMLEKAAQEGVLEAFARTLGAQIEAGAESVKGESKQVWLDGGQEVTRASAQGASTTVLEFHLTGRGNADDPTTERHTLLAFTKVDGAWKFVIPLLRPQPPEQ